MSDDEWVVDAAASGVRLDKFLADPGRLSSRGRAFAAIERGKVYVNDTEATPADAARRVVAGDRVRLWQDRPGSSRKRTHRSARPGNDFPKRLALHADDGTTVFIRAILWGVLGFWAGLWIAVARWLGGQPWVDASRIGIWGWS